VFENYLAAALRNLIRNRIHAAINLLGLSVGLAAALLIALFVREQYGYDRFFPGYRDVYLLTETKDSIDRRLPLERWDFSFPDLAAKLTLQVPQIAAVARIMPADSPAHIRHGQVEAEEGGFLWVDPSFFRVLPLKPLAGDVRTALAAPDSVVLTRTAARKYFGREQPLGELLEVNPAMGPDAAKVSAAFGTAHPMRVTAIIEDLPSNSYVKGEVFGSSLAAYSTFALYDLTRDQGPFRTQGNYTFIRLRPRTPKASCPPLQPTIRTHRPFTRPGSPLGCT
jgi:putative ABC transport system permease protein